MGEATDEPLPRRRDLRKREKAREATRLSFTETISPEASGSETEVTGPDLDTPDWEPDSLDAATAAPPADAGDVAEPVYTTNESGRPAFRGSDGSLIKAHKRKRRMVGASAAASVVVAGVALAGVVLSNNAVPNRGSHVTTEDEVAQAAKHADTVDLKAEAIDAGGSSAGSDTAGKSGGGAMVAGKRDANAEAASKLVVKKVLPGCNPKPPTGHATNGELPASWLCKIGVGNHKLRRDAAVSFAKMNAAYKKDTGKSMGVTDSYRTMESQVSVASRKPGFAAKAGTSLHGWGIALDFAGGVADGSGPQWDWLQKNASKYGWEHPDWAKRNNHEPWHWEYVPARKQIKGH